MAKTASMIAESINSRPGLFRNLLLCGQLRIRTRLVVCFVAIILSMLAANVVAVWQFDRLKVSGKRLSRADQISLAAMRVHLDIDNLSNTMSALADTRDSSELAREAGSLRQKFIEDLNHARQLFAVSNIEHEPLILSTLQTLQVTLPSQVDTVIGLAAENDWPAVHTRLDNQVQALVDLSALLVERVEDEISQRRAEAIESTQRAQQQLLVILSATAMLTILLAVLLGWRVTRTITGPLSELYASAQALAHGEFHHEVKVNGEDELATVGRAFNYAARQLRELYASLRDSEEQWRAAFESNPTMYFIIDAAGAVLSVNTLGAEQLGYSVDELLGRPVLDVMYEPDRETVKKHVLECFEQPGRMMRWEARKIRKNGTMLWVRETAKAVFFKNRLALLVVCEDITEGKHAEESLRESEERFRIAFENAVIGMALVDMHGYLIKCNPALEKMLGYSEEELSQIVFAEFTFPDDRELEWELYSELIKGERNKYELNKRYITKDRRLIWGRLIVSLVRNPNGAPKYALGMVEDFTERKRAEEERERLQQLEADLAHINRVSMMGEMAASLAHEMKQPIAAAITSASTCIRWLEHDPPELARARAAAMRVEKDGIRAAQIIDRIHSLYKKAPPERELVDVNEVIYQMLVLLRGEANQHSISMRTELAADLPKIAADRVQLQQVLMNLILNGIDAMKDTGGELTIKSQLGDKALLLITVSDMGVGLPAEKAERMFDAFFTTKPGGSGMGLTISRSIVESHGGTLWATANDGRGAAFHFTLPTAAEATPVPAAGTQFDVF